MFLSYFYLHVFRFGVFQQVLVSGEAHKTLPNTRGSRLCKIGHQDCRTLFAHQLILKPLPRQGLNTEAFPGKPSHVKMTTGVPVTSISPRNGSDALCSMTGFCRYKSSAEEGYQEPTWSVLLATSLRMVVTCGIILLLLIALSKTPCLRKEIQAEDNTSYESPSGGSAEIEEVV